jgi:hypothetical protein
LLLAMLLLRSENSLPNAAWLLAPARYTSVTDFRFFRGVKWKHDDWTYLDCQWGSSEVRTCKTHPTLPVRVQRPAGTIHTHRLSATAPSYPDHHRHPLLLQSPQRRQSSPGNADHKSESCNLLNCFMFACHRMQWGRELKRSYLN